MAGILESCKIMARYSSTIQTDNNAHTCWWRECCANQ
jgi:hypothetical protein